MFEYPVRNVAGGNFKEAVVTCDGQLIAALAADKGQREALYVFNSKTGVCNSKIPLRIPGVKVNLIVPDTRIFLSEV